MSKLIFSENKTLKLINVIKRTVIKSNNNLNFDVIVEQMHSFILAHKSKPIGPLILYVEWNNNEIRLSFLSQCDSEIICDKPPYETMGEVVISNAMYCRYTGTQNNLKYAYDKINIEAFEKEIKLSNCSYLIYVAEDVIDVFVPKE